MTRQDVLEYISTQYGVEPDYPWADLPDYAVVRHLGNRKRFGLVSRVLRSRLHLEGDGEIDILNVKSSPALIGSLR